MLETAPDKLDTKRRSGVYGSLRLWALVSIAVAILPLIVAIIYTMVEVTNYTDKSKVTLVKSVQGVEASRITLNKLILMEQSIRQYKVLNDAAIFETYQEHRRAFSEGIAIAQAKGLNEKFTHNIENLVQTEKQLNHDILESSIEIQGELAAAHLHVFDLLTKQARDIVLAGELNISNEATNLSELSEGVQEHLLYAALVSISLALMLTITFVYLLTRPIKRIGRAIRHLGEEGFNQPIVIGGPKDLAELGDHLEWLRSRLNHLEYEKSQFIRTVSHELKTPLATLKEGTELLFDNVVGELNAEQLDIIQLMRMGSITLNDLIDNLLEYQRTIASKVDLNRSIFDMGQLIERTVEEYQLPLRSKQVSLESKLETIEIQADYEKVKIIISNLFSNALKFTPKDSKIGLHLSIHGSIINFIIEDQGDGISEQVAPFIFDDFYQGNTPDTWQIKGSGLGLSLVKHYLDAHNGQIQLLPPTKDFCGARFLLQIQTNMEAGNEGGK